MKEITISEFRTRLHAILNHVQKRKQPVRITRYGKPMAEIRPAAVSGRSVMGIMKSKMKIVGDIVSPASDPEDWEVLRD
jgi:prevent-host-death family protein